MKRVLGYFIEILASQPVFESLIARTFAVIKTAEMGKVSVLELFARQLMFYLEVEFLSQTISHCQWLCFLLYTVLIAVRSGRTSSIVSHE